MTAAMTSAQSLRTRINDVLDAGGSGGGAEIGSIAAAYARLSAEANARLRTCLELLRRGLRSEAIHHAEAEPELFGLIQSLDLRRLEEWDRLCVEKGLERPRPLLIEAVKAVNDAIAEEQRLQPLLRRHRDLALRRAPLKERVATLRALAEADPHNPVWPNDVRALEAARLREIEAVLAGPNPPHDLQACNALLTELVDERWLGRPRPIVVQAARAALAAAQRRWAEAECRALLPRMHEAQDAWDVAAAERLRARWEEVLRAAGDIGPAELSADVRSAWEPVAAWYAAQDRRRAEEEQFEALTQSLRDAVRARGPLERVEAIHEQLRAFNRPIDETLQHEYEVLVASLRLAARRRRRARLGAVAAVMAVLLAVASLATYDLLARRAAEARGGEALAAVERGELDAARELRAAVAGWQPLVLGRDAWRAALGEVDAALRAGEARAAAFVAAMERIEALPPTEVQPPMLDEAAALAVGEADRRRLDAARQTVDRALAEAQAARDARMLAVIEELAARLAAIDPAAATDRPRETLAALAAVDGEVNVLRRDAQGRVAAMAALVPVEARAAALRAPAERALAALERDEARAAALRELPGQAVSAEPFAEALRAFVARFPEAESSAAFARAAEQVDAWRAVEAWQALTQGWSDPSPSSLVEASERLEAILTGPRAYLKAHPRSPLRARVEAYAQELAAMVLVVSPRSSWQTAIRELIQVPVMTELDMVETTSGRRFYTIKGARLRRTSLGTHVELALTPDLTRLEEKTFNADTGLLTGPPTPSPQKALARELRRTLETLPPEEAAAGPLRVAGMIVAAEEVDPILRALLVTRAAAEARAVSEAMGAELDAWLAPLRGFELQQVNWMNGFDDAVADLRAEVARALDQLGPLGPRVEAALQRSNAAVAGVDFRIVSRGVVMRRDGAAAVEPVTVFPPGEATLQAVMRASAPGSAPGRAPASAPGTGGVLRPVGTLSGGEATLDPAAAALPAGTLVFVTR